MPKPDSTQLDSTQPEKQANAAHTGTAQSGAVQANTAPATNPDHKQLPDTPPLGLWGSAWQNLRYRPLFWVSAFIILLSIAVAAFPSLFTSVDPTAANLRDSLAPARDGHPMGFTQQGYDVYARVIYGARASVIVGIGVTLAVTVVGIILAGIVLMQLFTERTIWSVVFVLAAFGWPQMARVVRSSVISVKNEEYVTASKALGLSSTGILFRHVLPNCLAPVIVMATTSLGIYIVAEATLSYLGIGLPTTTVSWGNDISVAQQVLRQAPSNLVWPALALAITVLGFILMGDALKDSLDPKERRR